ncbi:hypothetical protein IE81DRAFT_320920 [Ceraceosorus guamensis]|uniref:Hsp90 chaperone protein kinase-targeting subunit n=1 Tax=Ceraceosorus guamensis TaxID=1522189 RepID=A0A316W5D1_9BASI|nr:hypothetical protein IE81DRAFT_320920 [Ceraceosorus guamensis]PWN44942.1 hypothetical protein IE81DRAFT_320920 [Ceraceosorus guamensis]
MPLNYAKWDALELSDDSDVEVHPNVDKKSFIKWKQRDIHEKRAQAKADMEGLQKELELNANLDGQLSKVIDDLGSTGSSSYSQLVSRLTGERESSGRASSAPSPEDMVLSLLLQINEESRVKGKSGLELDDALSQAVKDHRAKLAQRTKDAKQELDKLKEDEKRKITSEGIKEGWSSGHVTKAEEAAPSSKTPSQKKTETTYETINSPSSSSVAAPAGKAATEDPDDDAEVPTLSSTMSRFIDLDPPCISSSIPFATASLPPTWNPKKDLSVDAFEKAYAFLRDNRKELIRPGVTDALLVEAFQACMRGDRKRGRRATEKGLMLQYCDKLGKDGVMLFFQRMRGTDGRAAAVYFNDVLSTFARIYTRSQQLAAEQSNTSSSADGAGQEQIQLVAEDPSTIIGFEVPDGPPPDHIELEGEGTEGMDVEKVREFLQKRWDIFAAFTDEMKEALKSKELDKVNKVLGEMPVEEAEELVAKLDEAGILSFSSSEVRDETGKA